MAKLAVLTLFVYEIMKLMTYFVQLYHFAPPQYHLANQRSEEKKLTFTLQVSFYHWLKAFFLLSYVLAFRPKTTPEYSYILKKIYTFVHHPVTLVSCDLKKNRVSLTFFILIWVNHPYFDYHAERRNSYTATPYFYPSARLKVTPVPVIPGPNAPPGIILVKKPKISRNWPLSGIHMLSQSCNSSFKRYLVKFDLWTGST